MDYGLTPEGFVLKTFDTIRAEVDDYQRLHINAGLKLTDDDSLGGANVAHINQIAEGWEALQKVYSANDPDVSVDWALVQLCSLTGTYQNAYSKSVVTAQVTLNPNKSLPVGSVANLTGRPNTRFLSTVEVPADPAGGTFDVIFEAETEGATVVAPKQLSQINVAVSGWTAVGNTTVGTPGSEPEDNEELREKRERELAQAGATSLDAIISDVSKITGVVDVDGRENDNTGTNLDLPRNSVAIVTRGGADADIAQTIFASKAGGIQAFGSTINEVVDSKGRTHYIGHINALSLTFYAIAEIDPNDDWNGTTSIEEVEKAISDYINSLNIGEFVIYGKVSAAIFGVTGVGNVEDLQIGFSPYVLDSDDLYVSDTQYAESDVSNLEIIDEPPS